MDADTLVIAGLGVFLSALAVLPFLLRQRRREHETTEREALALRYGLHEPVSLHPVIDTERCIGSGGCVEVCPEQVLGIRDGQAVAISRARCIGHGLCERICPMDAIQLVFGTESRGVELPRVKGNFESNVPGLYIVGELGGMGLIRNAFEQGRQCIESMDRGRWETPAGGFDLLIVGCGPAGLSASLHALQRGLRFRTVEKETDIGGTVRQYPRKKLVMTSAIRVPGYGKLAFREIHKEALIDVWDDIIDRTGLHVDTGRTVQRVLRGSDGVFTVRTADAEYRAARVVLAIGRRGVPRKLNVPGEDAANVAYSLREPEAYQNDRILVVGGGDSAIEAALALAEQPGNRVWLSYRKDRLSRIKPRNQQRIDEAIAAGAVTMLWSTNVTEIGAGRVTYSDAANTANVLDIDRVFVFIGGELPTPFLRECGVEIDVKFGTP